MALVMLPALAASAAAGSGPDPFEALGLVRFDSGIRAPGFTLPSLQGGQVAVPSPAGAATLLVFWATW
jgi:hypothetical protein